MINWIPYETRSGKRPALDFINSLSEKDHAKAIRILEFVSAQGIEIGMPYVKLFPKKKIGEVRFKGKDHLYRIFFFHWDGNNFILTHGFVKKTQKTPQSEMQRAIRYRDEYLKRKGGSQK